MDSFTTIRYGNTIYNDGTISKTVIYSFNSVESFRTFWANREQLSKAEYNADVKELTISCREFVDATEYLNSLGEEE